MEWFQTVLYLLGATVRVSTPLIFCAMAGLISVGYVNSSFLMGWTGGYVLLAMLLAPYLRKFGKFTVPDFVGDRFYSKGARLVAVIALLLTSITYVIGQMSGAGVAFAGNAVILDPFKNRISVAHSLSIKLRKLCNRPKLPTLPATLPLKRSTHDSGHPSINRANSLAFSKLSRACLSPHARINQ